MLPRAHRLRDSRAFRTVYARGRSWAGPLVVLYLLPTADDQLLVGITAGRKVGKAVERNRVRRRLREAIRKRLPELKRGYQIVLVAREPAREATFQALQAGVDALLLRSGLLPSATLSSRSEEESRVRPRPEKAGRNLPPADEALRSRDVGTEARATGATAF